MKKFIFLLLMSLCVLSTFAADGDLDASFDGDGKVSTDIGASYDGANNAAQQADGKIVTVGGTSISTTDPTNLLLARYNTDGSLDSTFGTNGTVIVVNGTGSANFGSATGIAFQADGKILVSLSGNRVLRFNTNGSLDTTFGTNGSLTIPASGNISLIGYGDIKVLSNGKILVCGTGGNNTFIQGFGLARLNQDGSLDTTFGTGGIVRTAFTTGTTVANASEMDIAANGKILLGGTINPQTSPAQPGIAVYNADGSPDITFGTDGKVLVAYTNINFFGSIAWQTDGKIVIVGRKTRDGDTSPSPYFQRFTASGAVDTAFGTNGEVFPTSANRPLIILNDVAIQPDGKILGFGAGFVSFQGNLSAWMTVVRLSPNGALDSSFGTNGIVNTPFNTSFSGNQSQALTGFLQADGKIVAAGIETVINPSTGTSNVNIAIARYSNATINPPVNNPILRIADFDGDGKSDASVFRNGTWFINPSSAPSLAPNTFYGVQFGVSTDKLSPADFDGDGKTDISVWRESEGRFYILNSSSNSVRVENFGLSGDTLTVGDWDGDGKADLSTYREGTQSYFFYRGSLNNPNGNITYLPWGTSGDKAVRGDFDGDRKLDTAVFRSSNNTWYIRQSSDNQIVYRTFGLSTDKRVSGDFDGDGKTDICVFRDGVWYIRQSSNNQIIYRNWGLSSDTTAAGDYDGDGKTDVAVWRNGIYYILNSSNSSVNYQYFGASGDKIIASAFIE